MEPDGTDRYGPGDPHVRRQERVPEPAIRFSAKNFLHDDTGVIR